jgi:succinate-semialdehyde dehydrogenase/glutarate-semialdehyde dehydrogenase
MAIASINPVTGEVLKTFEPLTDQELEYKLALADRAFATYKHSSFRDRAQWGKH